MKKRLLPLLAVFALVLVACTSTSSSTADDQVNLSDYTYASFDGETQTFDAQLGTPTVVNFFASWCPTCVAELPDFERVSQAQAGQVDFVGLSFLDEVGLSEDLLERTGVTFPTGQHIGDLYLESGALGMPTTLFIDAEGNLVHTHTGVLTEASLNTAISDHLSP